jgi:hypothetical protein
MPYVIRLFLFVFTAVAMSLTAHADSFTYSPITFGSNSPFCCSGGLSSQFADGSYAMLLPLPAIYVNSQNGTFQDSGVITFTYDVDPGWTVVTHAVGNSVDVSASDANYLSGDWVFAFKQEVILCPATATSACITGASVDKTYGPAPVPPLTLTAQAEPNTGIYEYAIYAHNTSAGSVGGGPGSLVLYLYPPSPVPEPSTLALFGTGTLGILGAARRKLLRA